MEVQSNDNVGNVLENARREAQVRNEDLSPVEVPELGQDSLNRVTKLPEAYDLSGSLKDNEQACRSVNLPNNPVNLSIA